MKHPIKLAIITTHPIQYYAPIFQRLAQDLALMVFYTGGADSHYDKGFKKKIQWDLPLLDGYDHHFLKYPAFLPISARRISAFSPDVILVYGWAYWSHLLFLRYFHKKIPVIFRGDSTLLKKKGALKRMLLIQVYQLVDRVLYVGVNNRIYFEQLKLNEDQLYFACHAIDNHRFSETSDKNDLRKSLGICEETILILYAGKLIPIKNVELLLCAFQKLDPKNARLLVVGDGPLSDKLKNTYRSDIIHFIPFQNQTRMPMFYQAADLFCLPSRSESWGLSVNEAMAARTAILVSDQVGCAADLVSRENGAVFQNNNEADLRMKLSQLCSSRTRLLQMGEHSHLKIRQWSFENQINQILHAILS